MPDLPNDLEVSPAAVIHPNTAPIIAPAVTLTARGVATLFQELHTASDVHWTVMTAHVVGRAGNDRICAAPSIPVSIPITVPVPIATSAALDREIGPAAVIYPDSPAVGTPTVALPARRFTSLLDQPDPASTRFSPQ